MRLAHLEIHHLRILESVEVRPGSGLNVFVGPNGSGKTSILEGIHLLGLGRSFRSRRIHDVISRGEQVVWVRGDIVEGSGPGERRLAVEQGPGGLRIRCQGKDVRTASALARELPLVLISPDSARLLSDGAPQRRSLLDWLLFHVEPSYLDAYQRYRRALRQRNAGLRDRTRPADLAIWSRELAALADPVHTSRLAAVQALQPALTWALECLMQVQVEITYRPGWDVTRDLAEHLVASAADERSLGYTRSGPHRADLRFTVQGRTARDVLSRGEAKLFVMAVYLAQCRHLAERNDRSPVVLIDELASELDAGARERVFSVLDSLGSQTFVTAVSPDLVAAEGASHKVFHVERGQVIEVI